MAVYLNLPLSFVPNLAFDLLDQLWRGFDAVCFSRVLCRLLKQFALTFSAGLVVAARHEVTAAKYFVMTIPPQVCKNRPDLVATTQVYWGGRASVYHRSPSNQCLLYPQKRILLSATGMSALCQKRTLGQSLTRSP